MECSAFAIVRNFAKDYKYSQHILTRSCLNTSICMYMPIILYISLNGYFGERVRVRVHVHVLHNVLHEFEK